MRAIVLAIVLQLLAQCAGFATLSDAIPQLENLTLNSPSRYPLNLGGMNLTHCCLLAVNFSFVINKAGNLSISKPSFLSPGTTPASFLSAINNNEFSCGATYNGNPAGAPPVRSTYSFCKSNCNGWQISQAKKINQWIGPMVSFILPSLVFCLNIPKRREIEVNDRLFRPRPGNPWTFLLTPAKFFLAVAIVSIDTLIWLALCFVFATPMILSGVYEAFWDHRILKFLKGEGGKLPIETRAKLLYIILVGNLDLIGSATLKDGEGSPWEDVLDQCEELREAVNRTSPGDDISRENGDDIGEEHSQENPGTSVNSRPSDEKDTENHTLESRKARDPRKETQNHLLSMLRTQSAFGSAVGAPIVFFAGGFAYTIVDTLSSLGDNDTAHALAFGMWWMIIPHVAIISSLLLASNNPSTFEAIVGRPVAEHPSVCNIFALSYPSRYKTEWMWFRGRSKYLWIKKALNSHNLENALPDLNITATFSAFDWAMAALFTLILIAVPVILAFLISYFTPNIGVSCRSLTFLVYFVTQFLQLILWVWVLKASTICSGGILHSPMRWTRNTTWNAYRCFLWWILAALFGVVSILTSVGGTIMQLLGVYRNCLCALPVQYWRNPDAAHASISLGSNTADDIMAAKTWWVGMGCVAVTFLCMNCYWGWWYQRRLRGVFQDVVKVCIAKG